MKKGILVGLDSKHDTYDIEYSLNELASMYENGEISAKEYQAHIQTIMNDISDETLNLVKENLKVAKDDLFDTFRCRSIQWDQKFY